ncbi:VUT family protein [Salmonella enterica subsp. enterica serovar Montevideo]|nr:VUT family protein [Salmonella enterica subsp. enterica serovar Montevideo]EKA4206560.1 VUT family protein [Salmonella enterica]ELB8310484.1 VUT family protein [Salmonella enterica]ELM7399924.1 VUT family protein [Salmonella enterica]
MLAFIYIAAICAANFSVHVFGPAITPVNAFLFIGLDFVIRDKLHERVGLVKMFCLIVVAGFVSFAINPATDMIALASVSAFALAASTDAAVYQSLIKKPWLVKSNGSNIASSAVDSVVFPLIAFGAFMPWVVAGQFIAKVFGGAVWSWLLRGVK